MYVYLYPNPNYLGVFSSFHVAEVQSRRGLRPAAKGPQDHFTRGPCLRRVHAVRASKHARQAAPVRSAALTPRCPPLDLHPMYTDFSSHLKLEIRPFCTVVVIIFCFIFDFHHASPACSTPPPPPAVCFFLLGAWIHHLWHHKPDQILHISSMFFRLLNLHLHPLSRSSPWSDQIWLSTPFHHWFA